MSESKKSRKTPYLEVLQAIVVDWTLILLVVFLLAVTLFTLHLLFVRIDIIGLINKAAAIVDDNYYTSLTLCFVLIGACAWSFYDLQKRKRLTYRYVHSETRA